MQDSDAVDPEDRVGAAPPSPAADEAARPAEEDQPAGPATAGASDEPAVEAPATAAVVAGADTGDAVEGAGEPPVEAQAEGPEATGTPAGETSEPAPAEPAQGLPQEAEAAAGEAAEAAEEAPAAEEPQPVGSQVAVAQPPPAAGRQPRGVWTEEQVGAFRTRLRETTANIVDKTAGAVIETVNAVAAAIRSRTSNRRGDDHRT
jgi:hypothetical protein